MYEGFGIKNASLIQAVKNARTERNKARAQYRLARRRVATKCGWQGGLG